MRSHIIRAWGIYGWVAGYTLGMVVLVRWIVHEAFAGLSLANWSVADSQLLGLLLCLSWLLIGHYTLSRWVFKPLLGLPLPTWTKIGLQLFWALLATLLAGWGRFNFPLLTSGLIILSFLSLFDLYLENDRHQETLAWPFAWLVWYAGLGALLLYFFQASPRDGAASYVLPATLFGLMFWLLLFQGVLLALISPRLDPFYLRVPSLRYRVQLAIVGLFLIAFFIIGGFTLWQIKGLAGGSSISLAQFTGVLISSYVFFLLIAGVLGIFVAKAITDPLHRIEEGLRRLKLGNIAPLEWDSPDEIGILVNAYNESIAELQESFAQLQAAERKAAWQEMAKQVAHEIKNPLTPMRLSVQHLQRVSQLRPEETAPLLEKVSKTLLEQIDSLTRIANEFAHFAKMPQPEHAVFDLRTALDSVFALFEEQQSPQFQLQLVRPDLPLPIYADREQLTRVLTNLVQNARQAIPEGRPGQVVLRTELRDNWVVTSVSDNGSGIPAEIQPKVFLPNFTTKSSGMGLGLAMAKSIVEASGGKIYFNTAENSGTTFFVEIKLHEQGLAVAS